MSFCMELANILECCRLCCLSVDNVEYRPVNPILQVPILEPYATIDTKPAPGSPYQHPVQIEITPPLLPLP